MSRVLLANCFPAVWPQVDALLSDELVVAGTAPPGLTVIAPEEHIDGELAHLTSIAMAQAAFEWFRLDGQDPSIVAGISAGDLAGAEAATAVLMPAARGVLAMDAALASGLEPDTLIAVVPEGGGRYGALERLASEAAIATLKARLGASPEVQRVASEDPRNACLREKYGAVRDPDYLRQTGTHRRASRAVVLGLANAQARLRGRGRPTLLVLEYNPSHEFARVYGARRWRRWQLVCWPAKPHDLLAIARNGDQAILPLAPDLESGKLSGIGPSLRDRFLGTNAPSIGVAGVELWPIVRDALLGMIDRYGRYAAALAPRIACELDRRAVTAVLVPFDTPAHARLVVRVSQAMGIPTFVINDGFKADDIQQEGMTADVALAWSPAMRDCYYSRRAYGAIVTGNPRSERLARVCSPPREPRRVLVGGHTFSPIDLNCRRSDAERFLDEVLSGIAAAGSCVSRAVLAKLHPADAPAYYRPIVEAHGQLAVELRTQGDVIELFGDFDVYVTTYSTSLLEAAACGLPVIYYRVNGQRMGPPFNGDDFLERRTASTPAQLASLLSDGDTLTATPPNGWIEHYLGPSAGAIDRILEAIESRTGA